MGGGEYSGQDATCGEWAEVPSADRSSPLGVMVWGVDCGEIPVDADGESAGMGGVEGEVGGVDERATVELGLFDGGRVVRDWGQNKPCGG